MTTARGDWERLERDRDDYERRAEEAAAATLPFVFPRHGHSKAEGFEQPYNSLGAAAVNNLASKLSLALMPPNTAFFKFTLNREETRALLAGAQAAQQAGGDPEAVIKEIDYAFSEMEKEVMQEMEEQGLRPQLHQACINLVVTGNGMLSLVDERTWKFRNLRSYVVERGPDDSIIKLIIKECVQWSTLPKKVREKVDRPEDDDGDVDVYTVVEATDTGFKEWQEVEEVKVPRSDKTYAKDELPHLVLRWNRIDGEPYGRGLVEQYIGDLYSAEQLTKAIVDGSLAACRLLLMVDPNGTTPIKKVATAANGAVIAGNAEDVTVLQLNKQGDFTVAQAVVGQIQQRLSQAFLMATSVQRQGERVTATEIRAMMQELEAGLGGVYANLGEELSTPLVGIVTASMIRRKRLRSLPKGKVRPVVVVGLDALGRGQDLQKLDVFLMGVRDTFGPEALRYINVQGYLTARASAVGLNINGLVKTQQQMDAEQQQAMQAQMLDKGTAPAISGLAGLAKQGMAGIATQQEGNTNAGQ